MIYLKIKRLAKILACGLIFASGPLASLYSLINLKWENPSTENQQQTYDNVSAAVYELAEFDRVTNNFLYLKNSNPEDTSGYYSNFIFKDDELNKYKRFASADRHNIKLLAGQDIATYKKLIIHELSHQEIYVLLGDYISYGWLGPENLAFISTIDEFVAYSKQEWLRMNDQDFARNRTIFDYKEAYNEDAAFDAFENQLLYKYPNAYSGDEQQKKQLYQETLANFAPWFMNHFPDLSDKIPAALGRTYQAGKNYAGYANYAKHNDAFVKKMFDVIIGELRGDFTLSFEQMKKSFAAGVEIYAQQSDKSIQYYINNWEKFKKDNAKYISTSLDVYSLGAVDEMFGLMRKYGVIIDDDNNDNPLPLRLKLSQ